MHWPATCCRAEESAFLVGMQLLVAMVLGKDGPPALARNAFVWARSGSSFLWMKIYFCA